MDTPAIYSFKENLWIENRFRYYQVFSVKACSNAHIALTDVYDNDENAYEVRKYLMTTSFEW